MIDPQTEQLIDTFSEAAQAWGWEECEGGGSSARVAQEWHTKARANLIAHLQPRDASVSISSDGAAAVDPDYYWRDINENTPRGVKLQLLTENGIALHGKWQPGDSDIVAWAPLPKRKP